jgi:hypothetical protein
MKKIVLMLGIAVLLVCVTSMPAFADESEPLHGEVFAQQTKQVNGPHISEWPGVKLHILRGIFVIEPSVSGLWTSPRGSAMSYNHLGVKAGTAVGVRIYGVDCTFSIDANHIYSENDLELPEGTNWTNTVKFSYKF